MDIFIGSWLDSQNTFRCKYCQSRDIAILTLCAVDLDLREARPSPKRPLQIRSKGAEEEVRDADRHILRQKREKSVSIAGEVVFPDSSADPMDQLGNDAACSLAQVECEVFDTREMRGDASDTVVVVVQGQADLLL